MTGPAGVPSEEFFRILDALVGVDRAEGGHYTSFSVRGKRFGYYWPRTQTVGLKQTLSEQQALVSERPHVFEEQFTSGGFGWVVVYLAGIELDELSELVFEAWRLSAPPELVAEVPDWARPDPATTGDRWLGAPGTGQVSQPHQNTTGKAGAPERSRRGC